MSVYACLCVPNEYDWGGGHKGLEKILMNSWKGIGDLTKTHKLNYCRPKNNLSIGNPFMISYRFSFVVFLKFKRPDDTTRAITTIYITILPNKFDKKRIWNIFALKFKLHLFSIF